MYNKNGKRIPGYKKPDLRPLEVKVDGSFEEAIKRFKAIFQRDRILGQLKERESYEKPSIKKRRKHRQALERKRIMEEREKLIASGEWIKRQKNKEKKRQKKMENQTKKEGTNDSTTTW